MEVLSISEACRALEIASLFCARADEGAAAVVEVCDLELVALILIMGVHASKHAEEAFAAHTQDLAA